MEVGNGKAGTSVFHEGIDQFVRVDVIRCLLLPFRGIWHYVVQMTAKNLSRFSARPEIYVRRRPWSATRLVKRYLRCFAAGCV
jgi:hypothetical protein